MKSIYVRNVSEALWVAIKDIETSGELVTTRNGPAYEFSGPVAITYTKPRERVLFYPERDANPFFHCLESLWMLAGRNDTAFVEQYSKNIGRYSDDGMTFNGAYGYRWRHHFDYDQLHVAAHRLMKFPNDRRTVVSMWDGTHDLMLENNVKDVPCNTHIYFSLRGGTLHMTVCNRSNDLIWGACGANAVHMSYLMEYMAARVNARMGHYVQFTNNLHAYEEVLVKHKLLGPDYEPYLQFRFPSMPLVVIPDRFDDEVKEFCDGKRTGFKEWFLELTAAPMANAYEQYKKGDINAALDSAAAIHSEDWKRACTEWLQRRKAKHTVV